MKRIMKILIPWIYALTSLWTLFYIMWEMQNRCSQPNWYFVPLVLTGMFVGICGMILLIEKFWD